MVVIVIILLINYSNDDLICANFVRDVRLGNLYFENIDSTNSILFSVCCD